MNEWSSNPIRYARRGSWLSTGVIGGFALVLLLILISSGAGSTSQAAPIRASTLDNVNLCDAMPKGPDWKPFALAGNEAWECDDSNSNPDTQVESASILKVSSQSADDAHAAIQDTRDQAPTEVHVQSTDAYGDPGYAIEVMGGLVGSSRYGSYIDFARNCYVVRVDAAFDSRQGFGGPYPLDQARGIALNIDQQIKALNLSCSAATGPSTPTAEQQPLPPTLTEPPTAEHPQQLQIPTIPPTSTAATVGSNPSGSGNSGNSTSGSNGSSSTNPNSFLGLNIPVVYLVGGGALLLILIILLILLLRRRPSPQTAPYAPQQYAPGAFPPQQYPPPQPYVQGGYPAPYPQVVPQRGSSAPIIILLLVLILIVGGVVGYFALGGKMPSFLGGSNTSTQPSPPQTFHLVLPVYDRDNNYVSDPIQGSNGVTRRLSSAALPYSIINHGQSSGMTSLEVAIQKGDNPNFTNDSIIMSIYFDSAQGLADQTRSDMNSKYPGANYQAIVPTKGQTYQITDSLGWNLKITVDDVATDNTATMTDGSASPYPIFTALNLTAIVTPK